MNGLRVAIILWTIVSYTIGCLNGAFYLHRISRGTDIRAAGSGNPGTRNVARVMGWRAAAIVFLFDCGKGALVVWAAQAAGLGTTASLAAAAAVIAGHIFPVQLGFRGGKGVATALGAFIFLDLLLALGGLAIAALLLLVTGRAALAGTLAILAAPLLAALLGRDAATVGWYVVIAILAVVAHHGDVAGLWRKVA